MSNFEEERTLISFDVSDLDEFLNVSNLRGCLFAVQETFLAVATYRHILIMEGALPSQNNGGETFSQNIQITDFITDYGYPLCLQWLSRGILAIGFDSGYLVCFDEAASVLSENKFCESPLVSITTEQSSSGAILVWAMFESGFFFSVTTHSFYL